MKKIFLLILSLIVFSGCSSMYVDDGVMRNENGTPLIDGEQIKVTLAKNDLSYDAWGRPKTITDVSLFHGLWTYDVPKPMWIIKENGVEILNTSTLVVSSNGMLNVSNGGEINSRRNARYQPNRGWLYSTAVILPNSEEIGIRQFGSFNNENGFFFSLENGTLYAVRRTTENSITSDYKEIINVPNNINLSLGNVYDIQAQWRGVGDIKFFINLQEVHTMNLLGTLEKISVSNPAIPLSYKVSSGNNEILSGCVDLTSEGGIKENRQYNSLTSGEQSLSSSETAVVVLKINESFKGKLNTRDVALRRITGFADDNTLIRVYYTRDSNAITGGTWQQYNGGNILYQTLPTFTQTAYVKFLVEGRIPSLSNYVIENPDEDYGEFFLVAGDYLIITLEAKSNTNGGITIEWGEEI